GYRAKLASQARHILKGLRSDVLSGLHGVLSKAEGDEVEQLDLSAILLFAEQSTDDLVEATRQAAHEAIASFGVKMRGDLVNQINDNAATWARKRAANLVASLTDTTRNDLRDTIASGLEQGASVDDLSKTIAEGYMFSDERADLIAETETTFAVSHGALI